MRAPWLAVVILLAGCKEKEKQAAPAPSRAPEPSVAAPAPPSKQPVALGTVHSSSVATEVNIIVPAGGDAAAVERAVRGLGIGADEVLRGQFADLKLEAQHLELAAPALSADERAALMKATEFVSIRIEANDGDGVAVYTKVATAAVGAARKVRGWILDVDLFVIEPVETYARRLATPFDVRNVIVVHNVMGDHEQPYLDTVGLARLGLPELYVGEASRPQLERVGRLLYAAAQTLVNARDLTAAGEIAVDINSLGPAWADESIRAAGGTGKAVWRVSWFTGGDHGDRMLALEPAEGRGVEGLASMLRLTFGAEEDIKVAAEDDPELVAAAKRARTELRTRKVHFAKGIPPNERLAIKTGFPAEDDSVEWMWVDVVSWRGDKLSGTLDNQPNRPMKLREGSKVTIAFDDVVDYIHITPDGKQVGNYSGEIFRRRAAAE